VTKNLRSEIASAKRIVVKVGSSSITGANEANIDASSVLLQAAET